MPVDGDHVAVVGDNRKLLVFPLAQVPEMARGAGVMLQKYRDGGMADAKVFRLAAGLTWRLGEKLRTETNLALLARRARAGGASGAERLSRNPASSPERRGRANVTNS